MVDDAESRSMNRVDCSIAETTLEGETGRMVPGVQATCSRCGHTTESFGTGLASRRRCLAVMRDECPNNEGNHYVDEEVGDEGEEFVSSSGRTIVVNMRIDKYDVYIGRAGNGEDGYFGNPVAKNKPCPFCGKLHATNSETLPCFDYYFNYRLAHDLPFRERVLALRGKRLGCFCSTPTNPKPCHGHIMAKWIDAQFDKLSVVPDPEPKPVVVAVPAGPTLIERAMSYIRSIPQLNVDDRSFLYYRDAVREAQNEPNDGTIGEELWYELDEIAKLVPQLSVAIGNALALADSTKRPKQVTTSAAATAMPPSAPPVPAVPSYVIGFTGTQTGMTEIQYTYVYGLIGHLMSINGGMHFIGEHGDCVGADAHFDVLCAAYGIARHARPANIPDKRANTSAVVIADPEAPLDRNRKIVDDCTVLIAAPATMDEILRSSTWSTIRYAQSIRKSIMIVLPDGSMKVDNCSL